MDPYKIGLRPTSPTRPITPDCPRSRHFPKLGMWQHVKHFFSRDGSVHCMDSDGEASCSRPDQQPLPKQRGNSSARPVGVGLPRQATFKRQNSEKRERLCPIEPITQERRAISSSRPVSAQLIRYRSKSLPTSSLPGRQSAPAVAYASADNESGRYSFDASPTKDEPPADDAPPIECDQQRPSRPASITSTSDSDDDQRDYFEDRTQLNRELDTRWILNLSMHFRDKSDREKFFVTYAETPTKWRRVTVSCDYRNAEPDSLEIDVKELQQQRDKSMQIYEAIRDSLLEIKFYDTVTNLKLETSNGRLHVHVTEDINEIIPYPPISSLYHVLQSMEFRPKVIRESELSFEAHLSGFVYKVQYKGKAFIKKEIPGPDTVDEFLYEVNALHALHSSRYVIDLEAIITDDTGQLVKGLLIAYAERGAVVDLLYDYKDEIPWEDRERWATHAIQGLSDIHEEGYVQGDFTLSNIVVDANNNARIIDINRRGCPVGWEPPEIAKKIASNQRISMYIGQKTDLYQLGMTLWALAMDDDEPERHDPPLSTQAFPAEVPEWYQETVRFCLATNPRDRLAATDLLRNFPSEIHAASWSSRPTRPVVRIRTEKQYIDPVAAVERDDIEKFRHVGNVPSEDLFSPKSSGEGYASTWPRSSNFERDGDSASSSGIERPRGRRRISDHDLLLRDHMHNQAMIDHDNSLFSENFGSPPIVTITSDGTESHIIDGTEEQSQAMILHRSARERNMSDTMSPALSSPLSDLQLFHGRRLFPGYSETSEDTPRNRSFELLGAEEHSSEPQIDTRYTQTHPDELAGLGSHPNVSDHSLEQIHQEFQDVGSDGMISPPSALPLGYNSFDAYSAFEIEFEDEDSLQHSTVLNHLGIPGSPVEHNKSRDAQTTSPSRENWRVPQPRPEEPLVEISNACQQVRDTTELDDSGGRDSNTIIEVVRDSDATSVEQLNFDKAIPGEMTEPQIGTASNSSGMATPDTAISQVNASREAESEKFESEAVCSDIATHNPPFEEISEDAATKTNKNVDETKTGD